MLKKISLFILLISFIFLNKGVFWAWENNDEQCLIKNKTPDFLRNYIKNVETIEKNIHSQMYHLKFKWPDWKYYSMFDYHGKLNINPTSQKDWKELIPFSRGEFFKISDRITYFFNELFNWNWFSAETYYYWKLAIFQEIPPSITRDFNILNNTSKRLDRDLNFLIRHWYYNWFIDNDSLCKNVKWVCDFPEVKSIWWALTILKNNNNKIKDIIMLSLRSDLAKEVLPVPDKNVWKNIFLVETDFLDQVNKYYNKYTLTACSIDWWNWFNWFKDAWAKIKKAVENGKISQSSVKEWKEAIELAKWLPNNERKYEEIERKLLTKELSRQWLSPRASKQILNNLKRFNEKWFYSLENNFIVNTINYWIKNIKRETDRFNVFWEWITRIKWDIIPPFVFADTEKRLENSISLEKEINRLYEQTEPYILINTEQLWKIKAQLIDTYLNLETSIYKLNEVEDMACEICESQAKNITNDFCCPKNSIIN